MRIDRVSREEALELLTTTPLISLMKRGHSIRSELYPRSEVTFVVDTNPNYTNVCVTDCTFCSFYRRPNDSEAYLLEPSELADRVRRAQIAGATTVLLQGGHHPLVNWEFLERLVSEVQHAAVGIHIHPFSPSELVHVSQTSSMSLTEVLQRLWSMGIRTMPGGGAEILVDSVRRRVSPKKLRADDWLHCMRLAHRIGFRTSATMTYGHVESPEDIVDHLLKLRALQDETGGFYAFIPWSFKPGRSPLSKRVASERMPSYYLRVIAVSRIVLDNFAHIQSSWFGEGVRAGQLALMAGADDFGGVLFEENVLREANHAVATTIESVVDMIAQAGFIPVQRSTLYEHLHRYTERSNSHKALSTGPFIRKRGAYIPVHSV